MYIAKDGEVLNLDNESHLAAFLTSGWVEADAPALPPISPVEEPVEPVEVAEVVEEEPAAEVIEEPVKAKGKPRRKRSSKEE